MNLPLLKDATRHLRKCGGKLSIENKTLSLNLLELSLVLEFLSKFLQAVNELCLGDRHGNVQHTLDIMNLIKSSIADQGKVQHHYHQWLIIFLHKNSSCLYYYYWIETLLLQYYYCINLRHPALVVAVHQPDERARVGVARDRQDHLTPRSIDRPAR